jgi:hypothetical protein
MAGDDPHRADEREERLIETAEQERRRLEDVRDAPDRSGLDRVREALRQHDTELKQPDE